MKLYFNHRRTIDFAIAIVAAMFVHFQPLKGLGVFRWPAGALFESLMLAVAASSATMVGFVLAASTFLITHTAGDRFSLLRTSAGYNQLLQIIRSSLWRLIFLTGIAGLCSAVTPNYQREATILITFFLSHSVMGVLTLTWCTLSILSISTE